MPGSGVIQPQSAINRAIHRLYRHSLLGDGQLSEVFNLAETRRREAGQRLLLLGKNLPCELHTSPRKRSGCR